jgi:hypothetical protein
MTTHQPAALPADTATTWWRWPLLPFGAVLLGGLASLTLMGVEWLGVMLNWGSTDGWYWRFFVPISTAGAFGYVYAMASWSIAPRSKHTAATVMVTLLGVLSVADIVMVWLLPQFPTGQAVQSTIQCVVSMGAAIAFVLNPET